LQQLKNGARAGKAGPRRAQSLSKTAIRYAVRAAASPHTGQRRDGDRIGFDPLVMIGPAQRHIGQHARFGVD
jgi:hypothetical protein